jgi:probable phosphoglycerate mutase
MEVTRILAVRHGQTLWNTQLRIQGHTDIDLDSTGRWQADRLAQALASESIDAIYASDLTRAYDTAFAVSQKTGVPLVADVGLRERHFGIFEGQTFGEIETRWPSEAARWRQRDPDFAAQGGETLSAFYDRCVAAATRLAQAHPGQHILLVAHGGVLDVLYRAATRVGLQAPRTWEVANAAVNRLLWTPQGFSLVGWNDQQHLQE